MQDGRIDDDLRIRAALPTIKWLQEHGAHVTACSHLGRPKGKADQKYSMDLVRARLAELAPGVDLMENLRFDAGEEANDPGFVDRLVEGQDLYVDDAFGAAHRAHASIVGPPGRLPSAAGRLLAREVEVLGGLIERPKRPFRRRARRGEGQRQARRHRDPPRARRPPRHRRRDVLHLLRRQGQLGGRLPAAGGPGRRLPAPPGRGGREDPAADRHRRPQSVR